MALRSKAVESYQWGLEVTAGTGVAASLRYLAVTRMTLKAMEPKTRYRGSGSEVQNGESQEKVWSEFDGEAPCCYKFLPVLFNSLLGNDASSPYSYTPNAFGVDTLKTYTVEKGSAAGGEKAAYCVVKSARLRFTKKDTNVNFAGFGRKLQTGITMTAAPTKVACVPFDPKKIQLLIGADEGSLAEVKWHEIEVGIGERSAPHFAGNTDTDSFDEHVKVANDHTIQVTLQTAADIEDLVTASRNKELRCVQVKATSDLEYSDGNPYDFELTAMCFVDMPDHSGEADNIVAAPVNLVMTYDATFAGFLKATIANA